MGPHPTGLGSSEQGRNLDTSAPAHTHTHTHTECHVKIGREERGLEQTLPSQP